MAQQKQLSNEQVIKNWKSILESESLPPIGNWVKNRKGETTFVPDRQKQAITAYMLENTKDAIEETGRTLQLNEDGSTIDVNNTSNISNFDPVLISLVRRAMPNLMAYDICGVQPMSGPTGLIFALRSYYANSTNGQVAETFYNEVNTAFSTLTSGANTFGQNMAGVVPESSNNYGNANFYNTGSGMATANAEALGANSTLIFPEMAFGIEKVSVTAKSRALKAEYTIELAQDLKAIHGLDAETELANILQGEVLAEINREVVRTINITATMGATENTTTAGIFDLDVDSNGRWMVEKFKGLLFQIERECNNIAKGTRRGKGNIMICSSDIASALVAAEVLDYTPAMNNNLQVDDTGNTFAGVIGGRIKVFIDPYSTFFASSGGTGGAGTVTTGQYLVVGYKGANPFDAGLFYCPYVPLQMVRAVDPNTFQPKIGFKTRYGMVANPFAEGLYAGLGELVQDTNKYYRRVIVKNLM